MSYFKDRTIYKSDNEFPESLRIIPTPPDKLYIRGHAELMKKRCIAIVGARKCSEYGKQVAMKIAKKAVMNGFCVVSGMAMGIDNYAHQGALSVGGDSIAVLGTGVDVCYPAQHRKLYDRLVSDGLVISEYEYGTEPAYYNFPNRNRIISGLSEAVVVVEARKGSGSIITAEHANAQGKMVFAVPGNITSSVSLGTNRLIMEGAEIVTVIDDIFSTLGVTNKATEEELSELGEDEKNIYLLVKEEGEMPLDLICTKLNLDTYFATGIVSILEMKGFVDYSMGKVLPIKF